jgi:DNA polymerase elongation subunit (family B)
MNVWLKKTDNTCIKLSEEWRSKIHVGGDINDLQSLSWKLLPTHECNFVEKFEKAGAKSRSEILEIEVRNEKKASLLARKIQRYGNYSKYRLYDVDVPFTQMYLYSKDLFPFAQVEVENTGSGLIWNLKDSRESLTYELPPLRRIGLSVETKKTRRVERSNDELDSIIIQNGKETLNIDSGSEVEKLLTLVQAFHELDPDLIQTETGDSFIFPYLARRAERHKILDRMILGRDETPLRISKFQGRSYFSYGKVLFRQTAARLLGRLHIDNCNSFFVEDCGFDGLFEVARTCIIPVQRCSRTTIGTSMTSLQLYEASKQDVLIPWNKSDVEEFKNGNELLVADRGGFIFEPKIGIHDDVGELDFSSLYPTIMMKMNLSGETVRCKCCPNSTNKVPELDWNICERWKGIVPRSLDILLRKRAFYKRLEKETSNPSAKLRFDQRQAVLKWILVCSFGYLGFKNARFGKIDAHIATCAFSRDILKKAVAIAESHNFKLVHGIVDSMWLKKPNATDDEYKQICAQIEKQLDLLISFEGRYKWIVFLNSRLNPKLPVLNRYYGLFQDGTLKIRGIDLRRHDTPNIIRKCQTDMLTLLSQAKNSQEFKQLIPNTLAVAKSYVSALRTHKVPNEQLLVTKRLSKNLNDYTNLVPQAITAKHLAREGQETHAGQTVSYLVTENKSTITGNRALPEELLSESANYDSEWYVNLLLSSITNLFSPFGYDLELVRRLFRA